MLDLENRIRIFNKSYEWWELEVSIAMFEYEELERKELEGEFDDELRDELLRRIRYLEGKGPFEKKTHNILKREKANAKKKRK
jgi:hypothetical protein